MATFRVRVERPASPAPVVVIDVDGPLDEAAGTQLQSLAEAAAVLRPTGEVHVNLSAARAPDRAQFLAALHDAHQAAARRGCRLLVCQPPDDLRAALRESRLPLCDDADHRAGPG